MTTHHEALEAACREAATHGLCRDRDIEIVVNDILRAYLTTLAPADNGIVEKLVAERDRHVIGYPGPRRDIAELLDQAADTITAQAARLSALEALLDKAVGALEPFEREAEYYGNDELTPFIDLGCSNFREAEYTSADLRAACSTLTAIKEARHAGR